MNDLYHLFLLVSVPGIGSHRIRHLVTHFGCAEEVLKASMNELCQVDGIDERIAKSIKHQVNSKFVDSQLKQIEKYGAQIVTYWDQEYPEMLKKIYDPPALLYIKGTIHSHQKSIAVVGTRRPSQNGRWTAEQFGMDLVSHGIAVISGMARGIDTWAHQGAIRGQGVTYAILGCGLDVIYPPENRKLYGRIVDSGAVISEFPMNTEPAGVHFPRRNRIISGLSLGTVVIEAGEKSGALITAYMALEQGREVFAVPGNIRHRKSRGPHRLIKEGAKLVESVDDILVEIPQLREQDIQKSEKDILKPMSDGEKKIWAVLSEKPIHIDQIAVQANVSTSEALAVLLSLELKDRVKQLSGAMFVRQWK